MFSKIVKGLSRLILTSAMVFGVGLFLFGSEVKADPSVSEVTVDSGAVSASANRITITVGNDKTDNDIYIKSVVLNYDGDGTKTVDRNVKIEKATESSSPTLGTVTLTNEDVIKDRSDAKTYTVTKIVVHYSVDADTDPSYTCSKEGLSIESAPLYSVKVAPDAAGSGTALGEVTATYGDGKTLPFIGFKGEKCTVTLNASSAFTNYYQNIYDAGPTAPSWNDGGWSEGTNSLEYTIESSNIDKKIAYFPKIANIEIVEPTSPQKVNLNGASKKTIDVKYRYVSESRDSKDNDILNTSGEFGVYALSDDIKSISTNIGVFEESSPGTASDRKYPYSITLGDGNVTNSALADLGKVSPGELKIQLRTYTSDGKKRIDAGPGKLEGGATTVKIADVFAYPGSTTLETETVTGQTGNTVYSNEITKIEPLGADWDAILNQTASSGKVVISPSTQNGVTAKYNKDTKKMEFEIASNASDATFTVSFKHPEIDSLNVISRTYNVKVYKINGDETLKAIANSNQNHITVGYTLDLKALAKDCVRDASGKALDIGAPDKILNANGDEVPEGKFKPSTTSDAKFSAVWGTTTVGTFTIYVNPLATTSYQSGRSVTVTIPTRVSTGYKESTNITDCRGFYLVMEDSSGNTLASYDASKYQDINNLDSSKYVVKDNKMSCTIPASEIEALVTTAASNNKFSTSNDTNTVYFRAIPRGKNGDNWVTAPTGTGQQSNSATVYRIKASGANFSDSYAWGLDGQTVNLVAYPASGYKFTRWDDGNTSNPRSVTVSGTGTRSFGVLGERIASSTTTNGTGTGSGGTGSGGTGSGNSSLYDDVPKTAESSAAIWLIVFMVFAVMGTGYALYLQLKAATSKKGK